MLGFTPKESKFIVFLLVTFLIGLGIRVFQIKWKSLPQTSSLNLENYHSNTNPDMSDIQAENSNQAKGIDDINNKFVFINTANLDEFKQLPGIGPVKAERIIQYRQAKGYFSSIDELKKVKGIGDKTIQKLKPFLKINLNNQNIIMEENR
ncbi:MAG: helix-hairpin-helix domain-containing protein [bacterium]